MAEALPTGPRGRLLAVALTLIAVALVWFGLVSPLLAWKADLADMRTLRTARAGRMQALADSVPALQRQADAASTSGPPLQAMIPGTSDAVAAAALQEQIQDMARRTGATISSVEALAADPVGDYRRIGVRVTMSGSWPVIIAFLRTMGEATPRMMADDLQMQQPLVQFGAEKPLDASFSVFGFRSAPP